MSGRVVSEGAPRRGVALAIGVSVTFLWATSVVLIRLGLTTEDVDAIGFAGVRFSLAAVMLLPLAASQLRRAHVWGAGARVIGGVAVYGLMLFCLAQVAFYVALEELPASTVGLLMGMAPAVTALVTMRSQHERASMLQIAGIAVLVVGVLVFFGLDAPTGAASTALLAGLCIPIVVGTSARLGRHLAVGARRHFGGPLGLTALAMLFGGVTLLALGLAVEGVPSFSPRAWLLIVWLAAVNTALTYTLWTQTQRTLRAVESSVLGDLTVILVAVMGWLVLDETLGIVEIVGLALALFGVFLVQLAPTVRGRGARLAPPPLS